MKKMFTHSKSVLVLMIILLAGFNAFSQDCFLAATDKSSTSYEMEETYTEYLVLYSFQTNIFPCDAAFGTSGIALTNAWGSFNCIVRFNKEGTVDARNGGAYEALEEFPFEVDTKYLVEMEVDVDNKTYNVYVRQDGVALDEHVQLASDWAFREDDAANPTEHKFYGTKHNSDTPVGMEAADIELTFCDLWIGAPEDRPEETTSINNKMAKNNIIVFPNPTNDYFEVSNSGSIAIYSLTGKLVFEKVEVAIGEKISVVDFTKGVYMLKFSDSDSNYAKKIIIQ